MSTNMRLKHTRKANVVVIAALGVVAAGGIAYAAIPSADGVIHACFNSSTKPSGQLRVIDPQTGATCAKNETALNFNQQGPKGDQGLPGTDGKDGLDGAPGANGIDGVDGVDGLDGADGKAGAPGVSDGYLALHDAAITLLNHSPVAVVTLNLPAGSYVITGKTILYNADSGDPQDGLCSMSTGDRTMVRLGENGSTAHSSGSNRLALSVEDVVVFSAPGSVTLNCSTYRGWAESSRMTAVKVGTMHVQ
jgi:hypothetical protein